jgi:hypothetical protein
LTRRRDDDEVVSVMVALELEEASVVVRGSGDYVNIAAMRQRQHLHWS